MYASCFQGSMKRLTNFKSIVKTLNNSLSMSSPVPLKNNKPLLRMTSEGIAANKPSKNQVVCEKKKYEVKSFLNRRPMLKYDVLNNRSDHMPAKVMNRPPIKPDSLYCDNLSNIAGPHLNLCSSKSGGGVQLMNASDHLPKENKPIMISSRRHSGRRDFIDKKAVLTTKRSRNKDDDDCVVDSHLCKKRRCNSGLSDEEKLEHSKSYGDQTWKANSNDSDVVQKPVKRVVLSESDQETYIIAPITDHESYNKAENTVKKLSSFERIIVKSATTDPIQLELARKRLRRKIQVIQDMMTAFKNSQRAAVEVDEASINSILDCGLPPIYTKESYKEAERIVTMLRRNEDTIVNFRCRNNHPADLPLQEKIERELLQGTVEAIEGMMKSFINGNYHKRIAARIALERDVVKSIEFNDSNMECLEQLYRLYNHRLFDLNYAPTHFPKPLEWLGLSLKGD